MARRKSNKKVQKQKPAKKQAPKKARSGPKVRYPAVPVVMSHAVPRSFMSISAIPGKGFGLRVTGCEVLLPTQTSVGLSLPVSQNINPLNSVLFPKASAVAALFEKWRLGKSGIRFRYDGSCPTSVAGIVAGYVETDVSDTSVPANIQAVLNEEQSASCASYENCSIQHTVPRPDIWLYTQSSTSSEPVADRTASTGIIRWFSAFGPSTAVFSGYFSLEYDLEFDVFRPPTSTGFSLDDESDIVMVDGKDMPLVLSDGDRSNYRNIGPPAGRYELTSLPYILTSGLQIMDGLTPPVASNPATRSKMLFPPLNNTSYGTVAVSVGALSSDELEISDWVGMARPTTVVGGFTPYEAVQGLDGVWMYRLCKGGDLYPYSTRDEIKGGPDAAGDLTVSITATGLDGTETVLFTGVASGSTATTIYVGYKIASALVSIIRFYCRGALALTNKPKGPLAARSILSTSLVHGPSLANAV